MSTDSTSTGPAVVASAADLTSAWLESALGCGPIEAIAVEQIGTGQMSENHRVRITYGPAPGASADGASADSSSGGGATGRPATVVLKVAARDEMSRQTGWNLGLYEREVRFYREVAPHLGGALAPCHHASFDRESGTFTLLLGDAGPAVQGDEITGCTLEQARLAVAELGRLHGPALGSQALADASWLNRPSPINQALVEHLLAGFLERYADRVAPEHRDVAQRLAASFDAYQAERAERTERADGGSGQEGLVHGDYRLDNLLFGTGDAERPLTVVDWQTVTRGPALTDLAYFLGCALTVEARRAHAAELLEIYRTALGADSPLTAHDIAEGVRRQSFFGVMMAVISPMLVQQTERGDDMFMAVFARHCQQVLDLDALTTLPAAQPRTPQVPDPSDEAPHPVGEEPLWNESWYFDVADPDQGIGAYVRLGLTPSQGVAWYTALVCGPDRPTVAVVDLAAALPADDLTVATDAFTGTQQCEAPLKRYRVAVRGRGESHADPASLLRGDAGEPVDVELDLVWHTAATPYAYRLTTRYEIACTVSGTLRVGEETFVLRDAAGQRDHSWGVRDWWSMDWIWSAGHLDDGTHLHGLDLRLPGQRPLGVGYVAAPGADLVELTQARAQETMSDDGLGGETRQTLGDVEVQLTPLGHGPLRLEAEDGRVAMFPRAWGVLRTSDGRTGVGWMEWNLNLDA
jgi:Ser/Thr protein kinase RdoA (MazF antagonist)